jgi:hypothetical protein
MSFSRAPGAAEPSRAASPASNHSRVNLILQAAAGRIVTAAVGAGPPERRPWPALLQSRPWSHGGPGPQAMETFKLTTAHGRRHWRQSDS